MRKASTAAVAVTCGTIVVIGWQIGSVPVTERPQAETKAHILAPSATPSSMASVPTTLPTATSAPSVETTTPAVTQTPVSPASQTIVGDLVQTRFGNVQVQATFSGKTITDVQPVKLTDRDRKSVQISEYAAPILRESVLSSQSAQVDSVSGATYTSDGYLQSLQSAIDKNNA